MIFILILFLFLCLKFLYNKPKGFIKNNNKFNLKIIKNKLFTKKLNINFKFLIKENLSYYNLKLLDNILLKLSYNVPKFYDNYDLNTKPIFIHDYDQKIINIAKKYIDFNDYNINNISKEQLEELKNKNVNYNVSNRIILPTKKIDIKNLLFKTSYSFNCYQLNIYKNSNMEVAHYDFGKYDILRITPYKKSDIKFIYFNPLKDYKNKLMISDQQKDFISVKCYNKQNFFSFSTCPTFVHFSKTTDSYSRQNCLFCYYDLTVAKTTDLFFCFSDKKQDIISLEQLLINQKNVDSFSIKDLIIK